MKKSLYLKLSQQETNKKIQLSLVEKHERIRQKNSLFGYLYFVVAYVSYSCVAIISFLHCWVMISKDFRFTPHYLQTVIDYNNMSNEQANQYLNIQLKEYLKSKSYGNFSLAQRDTINTTFELLLEKYKLIEPEDNKHMAVMSGLSKIENLSLENSQDILNLNSGMKEVSAELSSQITDQNATIGRQLTNIEQSVAEGSSTAKELMSALSDQVVNQGQDISSQITNKSNIMEEQLVNIERSVVEDDSEAKKSVSFLSDQIASQGQKISFQIQDQGNQLRGELAKTNDKISESANTLSEQNIAIKDEIISASQSVNDVLDGVNNITDKVCELSTQQINSFSDTQEKLESINNSVDTVKSAIEPITSYTEQKKQEARDLEDQRENLRQQQLERAKKIRGRENTKNPKNFECSLTDDQLELLLECCNEIKVFRHPVTKQELGDVLLCMHKQPLQTTNARLLSLLLFNLQNADYIHYEWQSIAARNVCFKSKLGNDLKTNNDFSTATAASGTVNEKKEQIILEYIKKMKSFD